MATLVCALASRWRCGEGGAEEIKKEGDRAGGIRRRRRKRIGVTYKYMLLYNLVLKKVEKNQAKRKRKR